MLSGVTHETRVLCSKLCSAGGIMLKLCRIKMTLRTPPYPNPIGLYLPAMMQIHELYTSLKAWHKEVARPLSIPKCSGGTSLRYPVPKIFALLSTLYILAGVSGKICIHFSQFSETTALCCKNISIMPAFDAANQEIMR